MSVVKKFENVSYFVLSMNEKMFLNVLDRKQAFLDYKNVPVI